MKAIRPHSVLHPFHLDKNLESGFEDALLAISEIRNRFCKGGGTSIYMHEVPACCYPVLHGVEYCSSVH